MAQDRVEAVERALTILSAFDCSQEQFTLAELASATGYYKSTLLRLLGSLERFDYVQRGSDGRYRMGRAPLRLARRHLPSRQLEAWLQPVLDALAAASGETAALIEADAGSAECRLVALPDTTLRHDLRPGLEWHVAASTDPAMEFTGGIMVCRHLTISPGNLWLSLSGPGGRLARHVAEAHLEVALSELTQRPAGERGNIAEEPA
ncbi:transcriptional regulator, IclR family [Modicisalibacter muralis]|uniref:Transcriptional regulator, IclR family n=1 Tax=Modicisalibacter muralis TaxID=119000 RepID=A0A1G9F4V7_9GAMM|nr:helix-turn-helix domain-containing protein [Halomonas muralis]SDK83380.1 transcriptional regulator, IclR family [Halomonas muralis]